MELTHFDIEAMSVKPHKLQLKHPLSGELLDSFIDVISIKSSKYKRTLTERGLAVKDESDADEMEQKGAELLSCLVTGWENIELEGKVLEYSDQAAIDMMVRFSWIGDQVLLAAQDESFFFSDCPTS